MAEESGQWSVVSCQWARTVADSPHVPKIISPKIRTDLQKGSLRILLDVLVYHDELPFV